MTPKDATKIARTALANFAWPVDGPSPIGQIADAILAACAEERHAALDEAAHVVCIPHCYAAILALRDQEKP